MAYLLKSNVVSSSMPCSAAPQTGRPIWGFASCKVEPPVQEVLPEDPQVPITLWATPLENHGTLVCGVAGTRLLRLCALGRVPPRTLP